MEIYESKHGLDAAKYLTSGALAVHASLKMAQSSIQLLTCPQQHLFWESSLRGGFVCVSERYARSNQPSLPDYHPEEELSAIVYFDKNNLYGFGLQSYLPVGVQTWLAEDRLEGLGECIQSIHDEADTGYFLCVDLT
jgi:hypothetical protein